jgi:hypothetical protein
MGLPINAGLAPEGNVARAGFRVARFFSLFCPKTRSRILAQIPSLIFSTPPIFLSLHRSNGQNS